MSTLPSVTLSPWGPAHFASPAGGNGRHTSTWLAEGKLQHTDAFPCCWRDVWRNKRWLWRGGEHLQITLDLAALRCSCLHAGGTTACSVARLERGQGQKFRAPETPLQSWCQGPPSPAITGLVVRIVFILAALIFCEC